MSELSGRLIADIRSAAGQLSRAEETDDDFRELAEFEGIVAHHIQELEEAAERGASHVTIPVDQLRDHLDTQLRYLLELYLAMVVLDAPLAETRDRAFRLMPQKPVEL